MSLITQHQFEAARDGDQSAILRLLETAQPDIRRYARAACRTPSDADDAAQDALWLLVRKVGTVRSAMALPRWLYIVVRRLCLKQVARAGMIKLGFEDELEAIVTSRPDSELRLYIAAAFEALPEQYRQIALMRDVREMTIDEIAFALGLTEQATKARLHRARAMVRERLAGSRADQ